MGRAMLELRDALSRGAGIPAERVAIHCVHQHDAPLLDFEIEQLLGVGTFPRAWWDGLLETAGQAAREATGRAAEVTEVGHAEARLRGCASNRRILGADGRVRGMRWSRCQDPELVAEPVGVIDPMLRTVAFRGPGGRLLGSMSFYATHPQVSSGRGIYSADAPGEAIRLVTERAGGGAHAFFTGAGGNVTAGKHTSLTDLEGNLSRCGGILGDGIVRSLAGMRWEEAEDMAWQSQSFPFPAAECKRASLRAELADPSVAPARKRIAAPVLGAMEYVGSTPYRLSMLSLGSASIIFMAGEPFVEYQLFAQSLVPERFLAVAANCGDDFLYLPTAAAFPQGGYEVDFFRWCTPEIQERLEGALRSLLR
jgi:hypothetical protein